MEMKGEKINVSNIEKNIRDTYDDLKKNSGIQKFFTGIENGAKTCFQCVVCRGIAGRNLSVYPGFLVSAVSRKRYKFQHLSYSMQLHIVRAITDFENHPFTHPEYPFITDHLYLGPLSIPVQLE